MLVFKTPGLIPLDAFATFGVNSKPNTPTPIGFFGTGLKYAVAIVLRLGGTFRLFRGEDEYEFYVSRKEFRGKDFDFVRMRKRTLMGKWGRSTKLPFTLELGKNWDAWMAVRELESNTRDEGGDSWVVHNDATWGRMVTQNHTVIVIEWHEMETAYEDGTIFLDKSRKKIATESAHVEIYSGQSPYVYMNGIRVMKPDRPCAFTYNVTRPLELTEDRSPKSTFLVGYYILEALQKMTEETDLDDLFRLDDGKYYETTLAFDEVNLHQPNEQYKRRLAYAAEYGSGAFSRAASYHKSTTTINMGGKKAVTMSLQDWVDIANGRQISEAQRTKIVQSLEADYPDLSAIGLVQAHAD